MVPGIKSSILDCVMIACFQGAFAGFQNPALSLFVWHFLKEAQGLIRHVVFPAAEMNGHFAVSHSSFLPSKCLSAFSLYLISYPHPLIIGNFFSAVPGKSGFRWFAILYNQVYSWLSSTEVVEVFPNLDEQVLQNVIGVFMFNPPFSGYARIIFPGISG